MMNWNDLRVEQEIAQERYQRLIRDREIDRLIRQSRPERPLVQQLLVRMKKRFEQWSKKLQPHQPWKRSDPVCCS